MLVPGRRRPIASEAPSALLARSSGPTRPASPRDKAGGGFNVAAHGLRGLAAMMVLLAHILGGTAKHIYAQNDAYVQGIAGAWALGTFGVELFFIISGYVILPSAMRYGAQQFALRRFLRLYPLFFVLSLFFIALNAITNAYPALNSTKAVISGLLFINLFTGTEQLTPNAWSLTYEVIFYLLMYGIVYFTVHHRNRARAAVAIVVGLGFLLTHPIAIYFVIGAAIRLASARPWRWPIPARGLELASLIAMIAFASRGHFEYSWSDFADPVLVPIILSAGLYFHCAVQPGSLTARALDNPLFRYLGTVSYSLYLVHPYSYYGIRRIFDHFGWFTDNVLGSIAIFAVVVVAVTMPLTHLVHISLEIWPYQRFFGQRIYREKGSAAAQAQPAGDGA